MIEVHTGQPLTIAGEPDTLSTIRRRHLLVRHPLVPAPEKMREPRSLQLNVHARYTLDDVFDRVRDDSSLRFTYAMGASLGRAVGLTLNAMHEQTGEALGSFDWRNVIVTPEGDLAIVLHAPTNHPTCAPEIRLGEKPSPASDVYAVWSSLQPLFGVVDVPDAMRVAVLGQGPPDSSYLAQFQQVQAIASASRRSERYEDFPTALASWRKLWDALGVGPDDQALHAFLADMHNANPTSPPEASEPTLMIGTEVRWLTTPSGRAIDLRRRASCRRLVDHLAQRAEAGNAEPVDVPTMIAVGWPDERMLEEAGKNRLYVTLSRLRGLGFDEVLEHIEGGYRILPGVRVRR